MSSLERNYWCARSLTFAKWPVTCCGSQPVSEWVLVCLSSVPSCLPSLPGGHHSGICFFLPWNMLKAREHENTRKRGRFYASERIIGSDWLKQSKAKLSWFLPRMLLNRALPFTPAGLDGAQATWTLNTNKQGKAGGKLNSAYIAAPARIFGLKFRQAQGEQNRKNNKMLKWRYEYVLASHVPCRSLLSQMKQSWDAWRSLQMCISGQILSRSREEPARWQHLASPTATRGLREWNRENDRF